MSTETAQLVKYQRDWLADRARQKLLVKSRRIGGSHVLALAIASAAAGIDLIARTREKPRSQVVVSASDAQAKKLLARVVHVLRGFETVTGALIDGEPLVQSVALRNGTKIEAFSCNPASLRGEGADVSLDEFAAAPHQDALWAAAKPIADATLGARDGFCIRIVSTPLGDANMFHRFARGDLSSSWSTHTVTLQDAIADGFPLTGSIDSFREEIGDDETFAQEYECSFLSSSARYISSELLDTCTHDGPPPPNCELGGSGMDVARGGRHKSASVTLLKASDGALYVRDVRVERNMPWDAQEAWAGELLGMSRSLAVDATGLGNQFGERLAQRHGSRVLPIVFTAPIKAELFSGLRLAFERRMLRIPAGNVDLRRAILSIRRKITLAGNTTFDLVDDAHGHGDEAVALALALHASGGAAGRLGESFEPRILTRPSDPYRDFIRGPRGGPYGDRHDRFERKYR